MSSLSREFRWHSIRCQGLLGAKGKSYVMLPAFPVYPGNQKEIGWCSLLGTVQPCTSWKSRNHIINNSNCILHPRQKNTGQNGGKPRLDLNVEAAWAQGVTGKNVTTAIMDDGKWPPILILNPIVP